jgi:hypothetical protein
MFRLGKRSRLRITGCLLLALTLRSFVASGWMLQIPASSGLSVPLLSICPLQTQGINDWLSNASTEHVHHGGDQGDGSSDANYATSDPGCSIWASTSLTIINAPDATLALRPITPSLALNESFDLDRRIVNSRKTRAPPQLS